MKLLNKPSLKPRSDDERVLPLINVVFLLLIFFMLAGRLVASDPFAIQPPRSASDGLTDALEMVVLVAADGRIAIDNSEIDANMLAAVVAERLAEAPGLQVRLKADGTADAANVVGVMDTLRESGVDRLQLLTVSGE